MVQINQVNSVSQELYNLIIPNKFKDKEDLIKFKKTCQDIDENQLSLELFFLRFFAVDLASFMVLKQSKEREVIMDEIHILTNSSHEWIYETLIQRISNYSEILVEALNAQEHDSISILPATLFASFLTGDFEDNSEMVVLAAKDFNLYLNEAKTVIGEEIDNLNKNKKENPNNSYMKGHEVEQLMKVDIKVNLEVHFHQQTEASIFMENTGSDFERKYGEILIFCSFTLRQMINANNKEITQPLCYLLQDIGDIYYEYGHYTPEDGAKLVKFKGDPGRKRFINKLEFNSSKGFYKFNLKAKGFGFFNFNSGLGYYSPVSVTLLLQHLIIKNRDDEDFIEALIEAAKLCGQLYNEGIVGITNQSKYALEITNSSIRYLLD